MWRRGSQWGTEDQPANTAGESPLSARPLLACPAIPALLGLTLSACAIHHVTPYVPRYDNAPQSSGAVDASANCAEASTAAETAICASPSTIAANREAVAALQAALRGAGLFGRDALLASQRAWLLALPARCAIPDLPAAPPPGTGACLASALQDRARALRAWPTAADARGGLSDYVVLRAPAGGAAQPGGAFCATLAERANNALRRTGSLDPAAMGFQEVAGSHGPASAAGVSVDLYDANVFGLFQRRARSVSLEGGPGSAPVITPVSLTELADRQNTENGGGRFSAFASQTGDYGSIDVFRDGARTLVLAADAWGSTTPAPPGEAAHAGVWDVSGGSAAPLCLFDTYTGPADPGPFEAAQDVMRWREALARVRDSASLPLGTAFARDQGQLSADTDFVVLHMPLLAVRQAAAGWTPWLRHRHDQALDALFAWSAKGAANKALFDQVFGLLRPAAAELVRVYQTAQGLDATEATQAGGIAVMELLYQATVTIDPGLGSEPGAPPGTRPRYPILASPQ